MIPEHKKHKRKISLFEECQHILSAVEVKEDFDHFILLWNTLNYSIILNSYANLNIFNKWMAVGFHYIWIKYLNFQILPFYFLDLFSEA